MFSLIFALAIIVVTTLGMTICAMLLVQWMLEFGRFLGATPSDPDSFLEKETSAFSGRLASL